MCTYNDEIMFYHNVGPKLCSSSFGPEEPQLPLVQVAKEAVRTDHHRDSV